MDKKTTRSSSGESLTKKIRLTSFEPSENHEDGPETSLSSVPESANEEDSVFLPFEDSFSRGRYAGSFVLRFSGDTVRLPKTSEERTKPQSARAFSAKQTDSETLSAELVDVPSSGALSLETETELQEESIKFVDLPTAADEDDVHSVLAEDSLEVINTEKNKPLASDGKVLNVTSKENGGHSVTKSSSSENPISIVPTFANDVTTETQTGSVTEILDQSDDNLTSPNDSIVAKDNKQPDYDGYRDNRPINTTMKPQENHSVSQDQNGDSEETPSKLGSETSAHVPLGSTTHSEDTKHTAGIVVSGKRSEKSEDTSYTTVTMASSEPQPTAMIREALFKKEEESDSPHVTVPESYMHGINTEKNKPLASDGKATHSPRVLNEASEENGGQSETKSCSSENAISIVPTFANDVTTETQTGSVTEILQVDQSDDNLTSPNDSIVAKDNKQPDYDGYRDNRPINTTMKPQEKHSVSQDQNGDSEETPSKLGSETSAHVPLGSTTHSEDTKHTAGIVVSGKRSEKSEDTSYTTVKMASSEPQPTAMIREALFKKEEESDSPHVTVSESPEVNNQKLLNKIDSEDHAFRGLNHSSGNVSSPDSDSDKNQDSKDTPVTQLAHSEIPSSDSPTENTQDATVEDTMDTRTNGSANATVVNERALRGDNEDEEEASEASHVPQHEMNDSEQESLINHITDDSEPESSDSGAFHFYPPEDEPVLKPDINGRLKRSVKSVIDDFEALEYEEQEPASPSAVRKCCSCFTSCCEYDLSKSKNSHDAFHKPEVKLASSQGFKMLRKFFHPTLPKLLSDIWVLAELAITITQFVLSITALSLNDGNRSFNYTYLVLATLGLFLALLDSFLYFIQLGSCARLFKYCRKKLSKKEVKEHSDENRKGCCQFLSKETQKKISESFDVLRTIISELLIYPLVVLDLFDLIVGGTLLRRTYSDRVNFALFVIGALFLAISVYVIRAFMVISATVNLKRVPTTQSSKSYQSVVATVTSFCIHVLAQLLVHVCIVITIALKIFKENPDPNGNTTNASPFLVYSAIAGGIIPLYGVAMFFIVNYYQLRELSIGVWVDMVSMLQSESFAEVVFQGRGLKVARQKAKKFFKKMQVQEVKKQLKNIQSVSFWVRAFYPFRFPLLIAIGVVYELLLVSFIVALMFSTQTVNGVTEITFVLFRSDLVIGFFVLLVFVILANLHVLLLVTMWSAVGILFILGLPVLIVLYAIFYTIVTPVLACSACIYPFAKEFDLMERPLAHVSELRRHITTIRKPQ